MLLAGELPQIRADLTDERLGCLRVDAIDCCQIDACRLVECRACLLGGASLAAEAPSALLRRWGRGALRIDLRRIALELLLDPLLAGMDLLLEDIIELDCASTEGSRSPAMIARIIVMPVSPVMSLRTCCSWMFICVRAFCMCWISRAAASTSDWRWRM